MTAIPDPTSQEDEDGDERRLIAGDDITGDDYPETWDMPTEADHA